MLLIEKKKINIKMTQVIFPIVVSFLLSACCGFLFIPALLRFCKQKNLYDMPNLRKVHHTKIPRLGGIAFMPSMIIAAVIVMLTMTPDAVNGKLQISLWSIGFLLSLLLIYTAGIVDDIIGLNANIKFVIQITAASILPLCGLWINNLYGLLGIYEVPAYIGIPLTVFVIVFIDNAINLIDGIDGLAASLSLMALCGFVYCFMEYQLTAYEVMISGLIGVLVTYLYFNIWGNPEKGTKIFMGDAGSLTLGFIIAFLFIKSIAINPNVMPISMGRVFLAYSLLIVPTFDVVRVVLHRLRKKKPIFSPDKCHIHHKLMQLGMSQHQALVSIIFLAVIYIAINLMMYNLGCNLTTTMVTDIIIYTVLHLTINKRIKNKEIIS